MGSMRSGAQTALERDTEPEFPAAEPVSAVRRIGKAVVPWICIGTDELLSLPLGHREGFVLSLIDGTLTLDDLIDLSGMSRAETLGILRDLLVRGVIDMRDSMDGARFCAGSVVSARETK